MFKAIIIGLILTIVGLFALSKLDAGNKNASNPPNDSSDVKNPDGSKDVEIDGEVNHPGVYGMFDTQTLGALIAKAGGATTQADSDSFLSTYIIGTRDYFYIPAKSVEHCEPKEGEKLNINDSTITVQKLVEVLNVNKTVAQAILDYLAEHGPLQTLEELLEIKGVGQKTYEKIRDLIVLR